MNWQCVVFWLGILLCLTSIIIAGIVKSYKIQKIDKEMEIKKSDKSIIEVLKGIDSNNKKLLKKLKK